MTIEQIQELVDILVEIIENADEKNLKEIAEWIIQDCNTPTCYICNRMKDLIKD